MNPLVKHTIYWLVILTCFSCVKDKPNPDANVLLQFAHKGVLVLNEGSFGNNNSELSFIDFSTGLVTQSIYQTTNQKQLGDIANKIVYMNGCYYIAVNNSNKIVVLDGLTFKEKIVISNIHFPRQILQVNAQTAYVASLYYPNIYVLDLVSNTITSTITLEYNNAEQMLLYNGSVWITNWDTACNQILKINANTNQLVEKIHIAGYAAHDIVQDKNNLLWILSGNKYKNKASFLTCIDPNTNTMVKSFAFGSEKDPFRLTIDAAKENLYYLLVNYNGGSSNNGVYRMNITDTTLPKTALIQAYSNSYFYGIGIDSVTHHIFLSDPKGFTQQSTVYEYSHDGQLLQHYQCGIGSNSFIFN